MNSSLPDFLYSLHYYGQTLPGISAKKAHFVGNDGNFAMTLTRSHFLSGDLTNLKRAATDWTVGDGPKAGYAED
ncbi:hypothetical protein SUGI_0220040 [Cryptomeria japonica]|nr:hypothetical protein SUGI_0220040 [Cryptomeria japonica]